MEFECHLCNKQYASYKSLWNHNHKFHKELKVDKVENVNHCQLNPIKYDNNVNHCQPNVNFCQPNLTEKVENVNQCQPNIIKEIDDNNNLECRYLCSTCNKKFNTRQAKSKHYKKCVLSNENKLKEELDKVIQVVKEKDETINKMEQLFTEQLDTMRKQLLKLLEKECKVHPKTLNKINTQLNVTNNTLNDNKVINNNNIIIQLGKEKLSDVFTKKEQIKVLEQGYQSLAYLVQYTHFNPKYQYEIKKS